MKYNKSTTNDDKNTVLRIYFVHYYKKPISILKPFNNVLHQKIVFKTLIPYKYFVFFREASSV